MEECHPVVNSSGRGGISSLTSAFQTAAIKLTVRATNRSLLAKFSGSPSSPKRPFCIIWSVVSSCLVRCGDHEIGQNLFVGRKEAMGVHLCLSFFSCML